MSIDAVPEVIHTIMQLTLKNGVTNYQKERKYGMIVNVLAVRHIGLMENALQLLRMVRHVLMVMMIVVKAVSAVNIEMTNTNVVHPCLHGGLRIGVRIYLMEHMSMIMTNV